MADILAFYAEAGVDCALDDDPHDRFEQPAASAAARAAPALEHARAESPAHSRPAPPKPPAAPPPLRPRPLPGTEAGADEARALAAQAASLDELRALIAAFDGCGLKATATRLVFADGKPGARLMFVGEAPGSEEDRQGLPFVGPSGQLLDRMLAAIGLERGSVYIANVVPWRPPGNREPTFQEVAICRPFIARQIELCDPDVLVCLGVPSARTLLDIKEGILKARGRWLSYHTGRREIPAMATLHPAYLLRSPAQKRLAWRDFKAIRAALRAAGAMPPA